MNELFRFWKGKPIIWLCVILVLLSTIFPFTGLAATHSATGKTTSNTQVLPNEGLNTWVPTGKFSTSSLIKVPRFPDKIWGNVDDRTLELTTVRNEQASAQIAVSSTDNISNLQASVSDFTDDNGHVISSSQVQVRYVDYISVEKQSRGSSVQAVAGRAISGGVVADPLLEISKIDVPADHVQPIWFTFDIPKAVQPGVYHGKITIQTENYQNITYNLKLTVNDVTIPDPENYEFHLDVWMNPNAIAAAYNVREWSEAHWALIKKYFEDLASHGQSTITTTIVQNPWRVGWNDWKPQTATGYDTMVQWKYDGENWTFNYSIFDRYVQTGLDAGVGPYITAYSLLEFRGDIQRMTYLDERTGETVTKKTQVGDPFWKKAWTAFLNDFSDHLKSKGWLDQTYLAFDERPAHIISEVINLLENVAPEFLDQTQMAGTKDVSKYAQNLSLSIDSLKQASQKWIKERRKNGKTTTYYVWAGDHHPNTLTFSPAVESRMMAWVAADYKLDGFLRWAYNSWPHDVFNNPVYAFTQGDEYFVYPGENGPMSSIRWELLKEGIEDYELMHMLREKIQTAKH